MRGLRCRGKWVCTGGAGAVKRQHEFSGTCERRPSSGTPRRTRCTEPRGLLQLTALTCFPASLLPRTPSKRAAHWHKTHLVHTGVGEQEGGILVRDSRATWHKCVTALSEIVGKGLANLCGGPVTELGGGGRGLRGRVGVTVCSRHCCCARCGEKAAETGGRRAIRMRRRARARQRCSYRFLLLNSCAKDVRECGRYVLSWDAMMVVVMKRSRAANQRLEHPSSARKAGMKKWVSV